MGFKTLQGTLFLSRVKGGDEKNRYSNSIRLEISITLLLKLNLHNFELFLRFVRSKGSFLFKNQSNEGPPFFFMH